MIKTIIFDMDGVIVDTEPLSFKASTRLLKKYNKTYDESFHYSCMGYSMLEVIKKTNDHYELNRDIYDLLNERNEIYNNIVLEELKPIEGLFELLEYIDKNNINCAVVTGSDRKIAEIILKKLNVLGHFKFIISGDEMKKSKPDPWAYNEALKKLEAKSTETIILEDSINGINAAINAGCKVIAVNSICNDKTIKEIISFEENLKGVKSTIECLNN